MKINAKIMLKSIFPTTIPKTIKTELSEDFFNPYSANQNANTVITKKNNMKYLYGLMKSSTLSSKFALICSKANNAIAIKILMITNFFTLMNLIALLINKWKPKPLITRIISSSTVFQMKVFYLNNLRIS